jgi:hypothetical protein
MIHADCNVSQEWERRSALLVGERLTVPSQGTGAMKLKDTQVEHVLDQLPAEVIPDDHPTVRELESVFGPHTFFIGSEGLHVVERGGGDTVSEQTTYVVKVAHWADDRKTSLIPQDAEVTDTIDIGPASSDPEMLV